LNKTYYAGIGSRKIPQKITDIMEELGYQLARRGYILRSGASPGADTAFELGAIRAKGAMEIYLPWEGFGNRKGSGYMNSEVLPQRKQAEKIARSYHPDFDGLDEESKKLIIRDTYQVMGRDLKTYSKFIICWTPDGCITEEQRSEETGGTGQAIAIANHFGIPIFNLKIDSHREKILYWIRYLSN
jgi:hypothetical protein